jgi:7,8-dihydroneopterin aldolase/epimerase/oxygenase
VTDRIALIGLRARGFHGVFDEERRQGQDFVVDVVLMLDTMRAASLDDVAVTADYGTVARRVVDVITGEPVNLIETLAQRVADACFLDAVVDEVQVTVHKPQAPIPVPFDDVSVTVVRSRQ